MTARFVTRGPLCWLCLLALALALPAYASAQAPAHPHSTVQKSVVAGHACPAVLPAWTLRPYLGNRSTMIQVALVAVGLGIFILHKGKHL